MAGHDVKKGSGVISVDELGKLRPTPLLTLDTVNVFYGAIHALRDVSLTVRAGEVVTLIGSNGAGKSTTLRAITGLLTPKSGRVVFEGQDIAGIPPHKLVARGISMAPEGRGIFANLTVLENLEMGAYLVRERSRMKQDLERGFAMFPRLEERKSQRAHPIHRFAVQTIGEHAGHELPDETQLYREEPVEEPGVVPGALPGATNQQQR